MNVLNVDTYQMKELCFIEIMKIIKQVEKECDIKKSKTTIRIAIISSGSIHYFSRILSAVMRTNGFECDIFNSDYDGINSNILDLNSEMYKFNPRFVIIIPYYLDIKKFPSYDCNMSDYYSLLNDEVLYHKRLFDNISSIEGVHVFWCNYVVPFLCEQGCYEYNTLNSKNEYYQLLNLEILKIKPSFVTIINLDAYASYVGKKKWFDYTNYFCTKTPFALDFLYPIVQQIVRLILAMNGHIKKCLVLDLDNTLWGGIVGDCGAQGVVLDPNNAEGEAYRFFQKYVKALKERGVILAICSKNDYKIAVSPFVDNPYMILKLQDIACFVANWNDKASNIKMIASELNIGIDSIVFFDDNPAEREIVRKFLPSVTVIDVPENIDEFTSVLDRSGCFDWVDITKEDVQRVQTYQADKERKELQNKSINYEQYLISLEMKGSISVMSFDDIERFSQLVNKSNQFNLRTMRYTDKEILDMANNSDYVLLSVKLEDKFSVYGIIASVILHFYYENGINTCFIETLVMSCRVLKRSVESLIMNGIKRIALERKAMVICAEYIKTERNSMVESFFDNYSFSVVKQDDMNKRYQIRTDSLENQICYIEN